MSLNGTQSCSVVGSHEALIPALCNTAVASGTQGANACISDGLNPDRRKKFTRAAGMYGPAGPTPHGASTDGSEVPTNNGLVGKFGSVCGIPAAVAAATAACQFWVSN